MSVKNSAIFWDPLFFFFNLLTSFMTSVEIFYSPNDSWSKSVHLVLLRRGNRIPEGQFVFLLVASHPLP